MKTAVVFPSVSARSFDYAGTHIYELDPTDPSKLGNPASYAGLASALRGSFRSWETARDPRTLAEFDVLVIVPKLEFRIEWLQDVRRRYPEKILIGQFEENVRKHKIWCRSWEFQRDFYQFAQIVDVLTTFHRDTTQYYELFSRRPVEYMPHPYPVEWIASRGIRRPRAEKERLLFKAGYIHGRIGTDGFADVVPLIRIAGEDPSLRIRVTRYPETTDEVAIETDIRNRQHVRRLERVFVDRVKPRLPGSIARALGALIYSPAPAGRPVDPLLLRGFPANRIDVLPRMSWFVMLNEWSRLLLALDIDTCFTVGRNCADAAAVGTPLIGGNADFQGALFPDLVVDELDYEAAEHLVRRLLADPAYYDDVVDRAGKALAQFSYDATRDRFLDLLRRVNPKMPAPTPA